MAGRGGSEELRRLEALQAPADLRGDRLIDAVGTYCPVPITRTAEALRRMAAGQVAELLADDRVVLLDMPAWCLSTGHEYLGFRQEGGEWRLFVRKK
ncbi:MAG TPA: sulfurtransferase TusA family protein [Candidatus Polarisedimenticolia bacterium]|nr:sulfurtransferase TusA family protein [Candidatus Polarisedimenticolia bacterium]